MVNNWNNNISYIYIHIDIPSGYVKIAMERSTMLLMGKSTISMGIFSIAMLNYQRVG
jgi:hypothetical protein